MNNTLETINSDIITYSLGKGFEKILKIKELKSIKIMNKYLKNNIYINKEIYNQKMILLKYFKKWKKNKILKCFENTFLPLNLLRIFPILKWRSYFSGIDYIDQILPTDLKYPIMIGIDNHKRPFI